MEVPEIIKKHGVGNFDEVVKQERIQKGKKLNHDTPEEQQEVLSEAVKIAGIAPTEKVVEKITKNIDEEIRDINAIGMDVALDAIGKENSDNLNQMIQELDQELKDREILKNNLEDENYYSNN